MSLRIVHAVCSSNFAGVERYVLRIALAQAAEGHQVSVLGGDPMHMAGPLAQAGVEFASMRRFVPGIRALRRYPDADIVNTHMTAADVAAIAAGAHRRSALVSTRHFAQRRGTVGPVPIDALIARRIDAEIAVSSAVAARTGLPSTVVHTGVHDADASSDVASSRTILMAQRLQPEKHSPLGVRAFAASGLASNDWRLAIAGDGPGRDELVRLGDELGVAEQVDILGFRDDVPALLNGSAMLLATCPREGLGLTVLEAMSHAVPVVAAGAAGHLDLVGDVDPALLFAPDDVADAATRLRALADDDQRRRSLGLALQQRQRSAFTVTAQAAGTERVYREALVRREARAARRS